MLSPPCLTLDSSHLVHDGPKNCDWMTDLCRLTNRLWRLCLMVTLIVLIAERFVSRRFLTGLLHRICRYEDGFILFVLHFWLWRQGCLIQWIGWFRIDAWHCWFWRRELMTSDVRHFLLFFFLFTLCMICCINYTSCYNFRLKDKIIYNFNRGNLESRFWIRSRSGQKEMVHGGHDGALIRARLTFCNRKKLMLLCSPLHI